MRQAIFTKYFVPNEHRCSRVIARSSGGLSITVSWDDALYIEANHRRAAVALCKKLGWVGTLTTGGGARGEDYVYVFVDSDTFSVEK